MKWNTYLPEKRTKEQVKESIVRTSKTDKKNTFVLHILVSETKAKTKEREREKCKSFHISTNQHESRFDWSLQIPASVKLLQTEDEASEWLTGGPENFSPSFFFLFLSFFLLLVRSRRYYFSIWFSWQTRQLAESNTEGSESNIRFSYLDALMVLEWLRWFRHNIVRPNFRNDRSLDVSGLARVCLRQESNGPLLSPVRWLERSFHSDDGECIPRRRRTSVKDVQAKRQLMTTLG